MKEKLTSFEGKSMWRWLLLALLLTGIVSHHCAEPKSIYRIEQVISIVGKELLSSKIETFRQSFQNTAKQGVRTASHSLQFAHLRFLSQSLQIHSELAISNAPELLPILMQTIGQHLQGKTQFSEDPFPFHF